MSTTYIDDLLTEIQYHLLETPNNGDSYSSEQWTRDEVFDYLRNRQNQFLKDTAILLKRETITYTPGQLRQPLPTDWVITQRMVWADDDGTYTELPRADGWGADYGQQDWNSSSPDKPAVYMDEEFPSLETAIAPVPTNSGDPEILYVYQVPLGIDTFNSSMRIDEFAPYPRVAGMPITDRYRWTSVGLSIPFGSVPLVVPGEFSAAIKYGVMADMLSKVGRGQDPIRAAYCESRYQEGVEAAAMMLAGWQGG